MRKPFTQGSQAERPRRDRQYGPSAPEGLVISVSYWYPSAP